MTISSIKSESNHKNSTTMTTQPQQPQPHANGNHSLAKKKSSEFSDADCDDVDDAPMETCDHPVYDSDEDSDDYDVPEEVWGQRKSVLDFLNSATQNELMSVKSCSEKKIAAILESRPFSDWNELVRIFGMSIEGDQFCS